MARGKPTNEQVLLNKFIPLLEDMREDLETLASTTKAKDVPSETARRSLYSRITSALFTAKTLSRYIETRDCVYMIPTEDGLRKATREEVMKLISKDKVSDMKEVMPDE